MARNRSSLQEWERERCDSHNDASAFVAEPGTATGPASPVQGHDASCTPPRVKAKTRELVSPHLQNRVLQSMNTWMHAEGEELLAVAPGVGAHIVHQQRHRAECLDRRDYRRVSSHLSAGVHGALHRVICAHWFRFQVFFG